MKKLVLLTAILLAMVATTLSQKLWYTRYEVKDPMYGLESHMPNNQVSFENKGKGVYEIVGWKVSGDTYILSATVKYIGQEEDGSYSYWGVMWYRGNKFETIRLNTKIKLSTYTSAKSVSMYNVIRLIPQYKDKNGDWSGFRVFKLTLI